MRDDGLIGERLDALVFDWDGTAVADRGADATEVRLLLEQLSRAGVHIAVVSGTHLGNVDGQLRARPSGPGQLWLALNRGSELFSVGARGPRLVSARMATPAEDAALDAAAERTVQALAARGLATEIVSARVNRRKIDLIPVADWIDPPKAAIDRLVAAVSARLRDANISGLPSVVAIAQAASVASGLCDARITSDAKHVEIGLTDKRDAARDVFGALWACGVAPGDCLIGGDEFGALGGVPGSDSLMLVAESRGAIAVSVGVEPEGVPAGVWHLGGGPRAFIALLREQVELRDRRDRRAVPRVHGIDGWMLEVAGGDARAERASEALLTISDGVIATIGTAPVPVAGAAPAVFYAGVYSGRGAESAPTPGPLWDRLPAGSLSDAPVDVARIARRLDLHTGVLGTTVRDRVAGAAEARSLRFVSLGHPGTGVLRATIDAAGVPMPALVAPPDVPVRQGVHDAQAWMITSDDGRGIAAAAVNDASEQTLDRYAVYSDGEALAPLLERVDDVAAIGFDRLYVAHRAAWAARWEAADIAIDGDPELQLAVRVALFHLMQSAADHGEAVVGARGLTGPAYRGHVFWDADAFALPVLAATMPAAARAMLRYRSHRLATARAQARAEGRAGARFPWESAATGDDVTPRIGTGLDGEEVPILTGPAEVHIVADVALAAATYIDWTGDAVFERGAGRQILLETARYWVSRVRLDDRGRAHIDGVIGPDEYHEMVDDNAFTNVMARWNLRRAVAVAGDAITPDERGQWSEIADALVDGYRADTGVYEQFAGFFDLEDVRIVDLVASRPTIADWELGRERVHGAQIVKQADVLMLHHLLPSEVAAGSLERNLDYYEPRCAHGSTLSPGVHAALFARAGRLDDALQWLAVAARVDLDNRTGSSDGGVHLAAMATVWHALVTGFAGVRPSRDSLVIDPVMPEQWNRYEVRVRFRGVPVRIVIGDTVTVHTPAPVRIRFGAHEITCGPGAVNLGVPRRAVAAVAAR